MRYDLTSDWDFEIESARRGIAAEQAALRQHARLEAVLDKFAVDLLTKEQAKRFHDREDDIAFDLWEAEDRLAFYEFAPFRAMWEPSDDEA